MQQIQLTIHEVVKTARQMKPDIIIVPINGQYGNLNSEEAATLARDSGAKVAVPCHFWTFIIHRGDPQEFEVAMKKYAPECKVKFLHQGEMFTYKLKKLNRQEDGCMGKKRIIVQGSLLFDFFLKAEKLPKLGQDSMRSLFDR